MSLIASFTRSLHPSLTSIAGVTLQGLLGEGSFGTVTMVKATLEATGEVEVMALKRMGEWASVWVAGWSWYSSARVSE